MLCRYFLGRLTSMFPQECTCIINLEACGGVTVHEAKTGIFHIHRHFIHSDLMANGFSRCFCVGSLEILGSACFSEAEVPQM